MGFTSSAVARPQIPRALRAYRAKWPAVALGFTDGNAAELTESLIAGRLDIAPLRLPVSSPQGVNFVSLLDEEMPMVLPRGHATPASARPGAVPAVSLKALKDEPFILERRSPYSVQP